ncbi:MAG: glycosyltransferase [Pseudorhodoplanes sp.]|jgi:glycosyltransferase involved in cell wall biosynthesis|nr:glycosyltransferase [Pseudorhodoplanes sp.]
MTKDIAIVIESLGGGGAQHVASSLANAWAAKGKAVTVITFRDQASDAFKLDARIRRIVIGGSRPSRTLFAAIGSNLRRIVSLRAALKSAGAPLVLAFVGATNVLTVLAASGLGMRIVISERNDPARQSLGRIWDVLRRLIYRRATLVSANSRAALQTMSAYVPAERLVFLPNPLRAEPAQPATPMKEPFFLAVGRLEPQKAHDVLLEAFAQFARSFPDWRLAVLGDGPLRQTLERRATQPDLAGRVRFEGYAPNPFPWYRAAEALIHPALFEGLPNAVIEAMSEGRPVVVTDAQVGLRGYVEDGANGLVVPAGSAGALCEAMAALAADPGLRNRLGAAAQRAVDICRADRALAEWTKAVFGQRAS